MSNQAIFEEMVKQLGGFKKLRAMLGVEKIITNNDNLSISFRFKGSRRYNYFHMALNGKDLYDLEFGQFKSKMVGNVRVKDMDMIVKDTFNDVYFHRIKKLFENTTGLYLSL